METDKKTVSLVEDETNILLSLKRELHTWAQENDLEIHTTEPAKNALRFLEQNANRTIIIISDLRMAEMKGSVFLLEEKSVYPEIVTFLLTFYSDVEEIVVSVRKGDLILLCSCEPMGNGGNIPMTAILKTVPFCDAFHQRLIDLILSKSEKPEATTDFTIISAQIH
jgi:ActR/RegA family two-component response regulator